MWFAFRSGWPSDLAGDEAEVDLARPEQRHVSVPPLVLRHSTWSAGSIALITWRPPCRRREAAAGGRCREDDRHSSALFVDRVDAEDFLGLSTARYQG